MAQDAGPTSAADPSPELDARVEVFRALRRRGEQVRDELAAATATARNASGTVTVTVGAGGVLRGIEFGSTARTTSPRTLADEVMRAYRQAGLEVAERSAAIVAALAGPDSPTVRMIREAVPPDPDAAPEQDPSEQDPPADRAAGVAR